MVMKRRVLLLFVIFVFFILVFFFQKTLFVLMHGKVNGGVGFFDFIDILSHGLPIDMSVSGYLTIIPALLLLASVWIPAKSLNLLLSVYICISLLVIATITFSDLILYGHWGFHLDPIVLFYLRNPNEAMAGGTFGELFFGSVLIIIFVAIGYFIYRFSFRKAFIRLTIPRNRLTTSLLFFVFACVLFFPIRGGITVSTMNISHAYFSDRMFLNHAAINPAFNFFYLLNKNDDFESEYPFFDKEEAARIFNRLSVRPEKTDRLSLLNTTRPNIILFILESFSFDVALDSVISPHLSRFAKEGLFFKNFYANSFRTDRGLTSILSGYPAHPTTAILKYPKKTDNLPAFPNNLSENGYHNQLLYYGGDVNFANMRSYFVGSCKIEDIVSDKDFPLKERLTKWGVPDHILIDRAFQDLTETKPVEPFLRILLTLSSHEPFNVPTKRFDDPFLNAINYTDDCIGQFVADLKTTDLWDNTLVIFIADHAMQSYPPNANNYEQVRFHIPMIWIGGAVAQPMVISDYGSQNDLAATLLSQLNIDYSDFIFSKDMLHPQERKFSFYAYVNGFCMMDSSGIYNYDNNQQKALKHVGNPRLEKEAKAFFQMMYIDLGRR